MHVEPGTINTHLRRIVDRHIYLHHCYCRWGMYYHKTDALSYIYGMQTKLIIGGVRETRYSEFGM
jgi:hypothetical protein